MAAVPDPDGVSSRGRGGNNTRRADHLLPLLPSTGEPAATSRASRGSSSRSSEEARRAADAEGMRKQVILVNSAAGGHGGNHCRHSSSSGGGRAASPTRHHPASPPVSSGGGGHGRKYPGADDASSFFKPRVDYDQKRLVDFVMPASAQQNIRQQAVIHASSQSERRGAIDATNRERPPKVSEEETEVDSVVPLLLPDADFQKPGIMPKIIMTVNKPKTPKLLNCVFDEECLKEQSGRDSASEPSVNERPTAANNRVQRGRVGHGDPHPPPFFKCEVCSSRTAFYQIKCCQLIVCEFCGCCCNPDDLEYKDKQSLVGQKETLPKVKLVGSDLFLWENFSFPAGPMLCMAKGHADIVQYYFASPEDLMDKKIKHIPVKIYTFHQDGRKLKAWFVSEKVLSRTDLK